MSTPSSGPARRSVRAAFACFALILFTATHWPALKVPHVVPRSDLWIHASALATWTGLLIASRFFTPRALTSRNILTAVAIGIAYGGFDELTQAIPILHRTCAWDDWGADSTGAILAGVLAFILSSSRKSMHSAAPASPLP